MENLIEKIITSPLGSVASIFALLLLAFWLTHWVTKKITIINSSHDKIIHDMSDLKQSVKEDIRDVKNDVSEIRKDMSFLKGTIDILLNPKIRVDSNLAKAQSPLSLTDLGKEEATKLNAENIIDRNWAKILLDLETNVKDKNPYDIQEYCKRTAAVEIEKFLNNDDLLFIKNYAFKNGQILQYYSIIFALIIRDKYLTQKGIDISEVDRFTPKENVSTENVDDK
jgi:hypothetical protein